MRIALAWVDLGDPTDRAIALGLARELKRLGHKIILVGPRRGGTRDFGGFPFRAFTDSSEILRFHREERIELWHCHVFGRSQEPLARAAREGRFKMLVSLHLVLRDYLPFLGGAAGLRALLKRAFHVTVPSEASRRELLALCPESRGRTSVVYYGISRPPAAQRRRGGVRKPYVLSVARLAPYKGPDLLLMAFSQALRRRADLRLVLCGRDQLRGGVQRFIRALGLGERVILTGELPPGRVAGLLKDCEFLALSSRRENLPLAALEAMAAGKAVVAGRVGGLPELVRDGVEGFLAPPGDVEALGRRLEELAGDGSLRARMGRAALRRSREFSWSRAAACYDRLYAAALS